MCILHLRRYVCVGGYFALLFVLMEMYEYEAFHRSFFERLCVLSRNIL